MTRTRDKGTTKWCGSLTLYHGREPHSIVIQWGAHWGDQAKERSMRDILNHLTDDTQEVI